MKIFFFNFLILIHVYGVQDNTNNLNNPLDENNYVERDCFVNKDCRECDFIGLKNLKECQISGYILT